MSLCFHSKLALKPDRITCACRDLRSEKELQRHWTTDAAMAAQVLERPIHHTQHSSAQSQADGGEGGEVLEAGGSVYDGGLQFEPAKLS